MVCPWKGQWNLVYQIETTPASQWQTWQTVSDRVTRLGMIRSGSIPGLPTVCGRLCLTRIQGGNLSCGGLKCKNAHTNFDFQQSRAPKLVKMRSKEATLILQSGIYTFCYQYSRTSTNGHFFCPGGQSIHWLLFKPLYNGNDQNNLSTTASFFSDWWKSRMVMKFDPEGKSVINCDWVPSTFSVSIYSECCEPCSFFHVNILILACLPLARPFFLAPTSSKRLLRYPGSRGPF